MVTAAALFQETDLRFVEFSYQGDTSARAEIHHDRLGTRGEQHSRRRAELAGRTSVVTMQMW